MSTRPRQQNFKTKRFRVYFLSSIQCDLRKAVKQPFLFFPPIIFIRHGFGTWT